MGVSILVLIYRIIVVFIGVSLLAYRQMVRYNSENITLQVVEAKKVWTSPTSWGIYRFFVTYEYNGVVYQQRVSNLEFFFFHSRIKPYIIAPVNEAKAERLVAIRYSALKNCAIFYIGWCMFVF